MCVPKISRNRRENVLVLEKQWAHGWLTAVNGGTYCCSILGCPQSVVGR